MRAEPDPDALLTTAEAARWLGIDRSTLANYARIGRLKPVLRLPSGQLRWTLASIRRQLRDLGPIDTGEDD